MASTDTWHVYARERAGYLVFKRLIGMDGWTLVVDAQLLLQPGLDTRFQSIHAL
jgi:hypothetical protein